METLYLYPNYKISSLWRESKGIMILLFFLLINPILIFSQQDSLLKENGSFLKIVPDDKKELIFVSDDVKVWGLEENSNSIIVHVKNKRDLEKTIGRKLKRLNKISKKHLKINTLTKDSVYYNTFLFKPLKKINFFSFWNNSIQQLYFPQTQYKNGIKIQLWNIYQWAFFEKPLNAKTKNRSLLLVNFNFTYSSRPPPMTSCLADNRISN